ncbi:hypothetical protein K438DRAFT_703602 [Mycena galopus ATCC 62051]|nr:hypothetical protein K438DRAFT_703602 [Mycena galopus ATCC 62051]
MREKQPLDDSLPSPLTSKNLRPRSEARSLRSASSSRSRGGTTRPSSNSPFMLRNAVAGPSSRKRERSGSPRGLGLKRARKTVDEEEQDEEPEVDELQDDVPPESVPSRPSDLSRAVETSAQEDEVESILIPGVQDDSFDSSLRQDESPPKRSSVTSPSLAKILHSENVSPSSLMIVNSPGEFTVASGSKSKSNPMDKKRSQSPQLIIDSPTEFTIASSSKLQRSIPSPPPPPSRDELEPLSAYACPICFFPPTNATLTPCGHVCCGACLFTAVKTMIQRGAMQPEACVPRCPVCRAQIPGWDGRGGGVIGLKVRAVFSL